MLNVILLLFLFCVFQNRGGSSNMNPNQAFSILFKFDYNKRAMFVLFIIMGRELCLFFVSLWE